MSGATSYEVYRTQQLRERTIQPGDHYGQHGHHRQWTGREHEVLVQGAGHRSQRTVGVSDIDPATTIIFVDAVLAGVPMKGSISRNCARPSTPCARPRD